MGDSTSPGPRRSPRTPSGRLSFKSTSSASPTPRRISTPSRRTARARNAEPTSTPAEDAAETLASLQKTSSRAPDRDASDSPEDKDVHVVSTGIDTRSEAERGTEEWALKERREALNRARYEKGKARAQRVLERRATATSLRQRNKDEAVRKMKRLKYKERMKRREADAAEKAKVEAEKARKAEQASTRRRLERRKNLVSRLSIVLQKQSVPHDMKVESLVRGDPLFVVENDATAELVVQFTVDHLSRLQPGRWLNQEIIDWYFCVLTSGTTMYLSMGAEFHRQLLMKHQGPKFVVDFHRPATMRGVQGGEWFCALEGRRVILAPANPDGNHWVLIAIFPQQRRICCYDSMSPGPEGSPACRKIVKKMLAWVALHEERRSGTMDGWTGEMVQGLPRQQNTWDCGIHVCDFARMLTLDPPGEVVCKDEEAASRFRARLLVYALETALISY